MLLSPLLESRENKLDVGACRLTTLFAQLGSTEDRWLPSTVCGGLHQLNQTPLALHHREDFVGATLATLRLLASRFDPLADDEQLVSHDEASEIGDLARATIARVRRT